MKWPIVQCCWVILCLLCTTGGVLAKDPWTEVTYTYVHYPPDCFCPYAKPAHVENFYSKFLEFCAGDFCRTQGLPGYGMLGRTFGPYTIPARRYAEEGITVLYAYDDLSTLRWCMPNPAPGGDCYDGSTASYVTDYGKWEMPDMGPNPYCL